MKQNIFSKKNQLDEMQEQTLRKIESHGFWLMWWGLFAVIIFQLMMHEIIAMQIERKAEDCYKAEYARRHLGECYEGRISGVTQRGLFIELDNGVEGFVPASSLTPSGTMLTEGIRLSDPVSGKNWSLGDTMMITIVRADVNLGKIDFEVAPASAK